MIAGFAALAAIGIAVGCAIPIEGTASAFGAPRAQPALPLTGRVVDAAKLLDSAEQTNLTHRLEQIQRVTSVQFAVVTTPSLKGSPIAQYALTLFNSWGLGDKLRNDGLMMLIAPNERELRIEVGRGLEQRLPDVYCATVIEHMLSSIRAENIPQGIQTGVNELDARLRSTMDKTK